VVRRLLLHPEETVVVVAAVMVMVMVMSLAAKEAA
jgi:hypothetical protein